MTTGWPELPDGVRLADGIDAAAADPALVEDGKRRCVAEKRAGGRCGAPAVTDELLCSMHGGRADPRLAAQSRHRNARERQEAVETQAALARLGTRAVVAGALVRKHQEIDRAIGRLADMAAAGDRQAALALIPWLNQALGSPTERVEVDSRGTESLSSLSTDELAAVVAERRRQRLSVVQAGDEGVEPETNTASA